VSEVDFNGKVRSVWRQEQLKFSRQSAFVGEQK